MTEVDIVSRALQDARARGDIALVDAIYRDINTLELPFEVIVKKHKLGYGKSQLDYPDNEE